MQALLESPDRTIFFLLTVSRLSVRAMQQKQHEVHVRVRDGDHCNREPRRLLRIQISSKADSRAGES
jgi:hypothetical protein